MSHVLEHLIEPKHTLASLRRLLKPEGVLLAAVPNIAYWKERLQAVRGKFEYTDTGARDKTHLRFFTYESFQQLIEQAGFKIEKIQSLGHFPLGPLRVFLGPLATQIDTLACSLFPNFFGYQVLIRARL